MGNENTIKNKQNELKKIKHHLDWTELEINKVYHIPPIITIERMDVQITAIEGDDIKFKRVDGNDKSEKSMKKSSILSRFLVKKLGY